MSKKNRIIPNTNPTPKDASAPWLLTLLLKMPSKNTAAIGENISPWIA